MPQEELRKWILKDNILRRLFIKELKVHKWSIRKQRSILSVESTIADLNRTKPLIDHLQQSMALLKPDGNSMVSKEKPSSSSPPTVILAPVLKIKGP